MARNKTGSRGGKLSNFLQLLAAALVVAAVVKELRTPEDERTWHGDLGGVVPYDFRKPTVERMRAAFWDPDGAIVGNRPFGVGWTVNFGAVVNKIRSATG